MVHVEHLVGLGDGAEQGVVAARAFLLLVEPDCGAFGVACGAEHRPVEVEGDAREPLGHQALDDHCCRLGAYVADALCIGAGERAAHRGHVRQSLQAEYALDHLVIAVQYVAEVVARHSDQALSIILPKVEDFALVYQRLIQAERSMTEDYVGLCRKRFGVDLSKAPVEVEALLEHNAFVCARTPGLGKRFGRHLTTGHIFELFERFWICLSPACDLVPSQVGKAQLDALGRWLPFMAVRLHCVARETWRKDRDGITSGRYVFVRRDGGGIDCFSFSEHVNSTPEWRLFHAENVGVFVADDDADDCLRFSASFTIAGDAGQLEPRHGSARIVGQLRYEYALNLLHRLGGSLTRIGLDFLSGVHP